MSADRALIKKKKKVQGERRLSFIANGRELLLTGNNIRF